MSGTFTDMSMNPTETMTPDEAIDLARVRELVANGRARARRIEAGLSIREVAAVVGVSNASIQRWETGLRKPRGTAAVRYGQFLERLREVTG